MPTELAEKLTARIFEAIEMQPDHACSQEPTLLGLLPGDENLRIATIGDELFHDPELEEHIQRIVLQIVKSHGLQAVAIVQREDVCQMHLEDVPIEDHDHFECLTALVVEPTSAQLFCWRVERLEGEDPTLADYVELDPELDEDWTELLRSATMSTVARWN